MNARREEYLLQPVSRAFIAATIIASVMLNILPWGRDIAIPDFVALVLVFWNIHQPRKVGIGIGFLLGLVMDVHLSATIGERALLYSIMSYFAWFLHRRVPWFRMGGQMVHVLPLFLGAQLVVVLVRMAAGAPLPGPSLFLQWISTTLLWPIADLLLLAPQRRAVQRDKKRSL